MTSGDFFGCHIKYPHISLESWNDKPFNVKKIKVNNHIMCKALHVSALWDYFQRLKSKWNLLYFSASDDSHEGPNM
jgi:hypothetical protein